MQPDPFLPKNWRPGIHVAQYKQYNQNGKPEQEACCRKYDIKKAPHVERSGSVEIKQQS